MPKISICHWGTEEQRKERFLKNAKEVHGDRYLYDKVRYINTREKVVVICRLHGDFKITPAAHTSGKAGCKKCGIISSSKGLSQEEFLRRCFEKHGDKYDYSQTAYRDGRDKVTIICKKHGKFKMGARIHMDGHGCQKCGVDRVTLAKTKTTEEFIKEATIRHNGKYDYSRVKYVNGASSVEIICPIHGPFCANASGHLFGKECKKCARIIAVRNTILITEEFVKKARNVHGDTFDYSMVDYKTGQTPVEIICKEHGAFWQKPKGHLGGEGGCPSCRKDTCHGFLKERFINSCRKLNRKPFLYVVEMWGDTERFIKIGITSKTLAKRFVKAPYQFSPLIQIYRSPEDVWNSEKKIHNFLSRFNYAPLKSFSGKTECYSLEALPILKEILDTLTSAPTPKTGEAKEKEGS